MPRYSSGVFKGGRRACRAIAGSLARASRAALRSAHVHSPQVFTQLPEASMSERAGTSFGRVAAVFLLSIGLVSCLPDAAAAQAVTGTIVGTVADSTGE